ncbi:hypothetical protein BU17DRAFT_6059, partial [Hysterangium stoloniferum]
GLEALGVMRPHWFASSRQQETQLKLISRFIQSLSSQQPDGNAGSSTATFESELRYTRDPHDVAAVLRWGLRHLRLDGDSFGSSSTADWYQSFVDSERSSSYPVKAFDDILLPLLPPAHSQLLRNVLDLVSSLAAHSEQNGISGNKLSKVLGWWIISSRNVQGSEWQPFYKQWEAAARQFEHLFLAYIRAQEAQSRMPKRLTQLVKGYPFPKNRREEDGIYLPRSRFSTRSASALFIRIAVDKSAGATTPHPLRIVEDAFNATSESDEVDKFVILWQNIRKIANKNDSKRADGTNDSEVALDLSAVLADESIRLLSLVPVTEDPNGATSSLWAPMTITRGRRSLSVDERPISTATTSAENARISPSTTARDIDVVTDWQAFSSAGFESPSGISLAASLFDNDTEISQPVPKKTAVLNRKTLSLRSTSPRRTSKESPLIAPQPVLNHQPRKLTFSRPELVKLDEAFIDFWADTLLDAIARNWPTFVVCQLKTLPLLQLNEGDKPIEWLVIERFIAAPVTVQDLPIPTGKTPSPPASPSKSESSKPAKWLAPTFSPTRKRWSLFAPKHDSAPAIQGGKDRSSKKAAVSAKVGEMGEILKEEDEGSTKTNGVKENGAHGVKENGAHGVKENVSENVATIAAAAAGPETLAGILKEPSEKPIPSEGKKDSTEIASPGPQPPATDTVDAPQPALEVVAEVPATEVNVSVPLRETIKEPVTLPAPAEVVDESSIVQQLAEPIPAVEELALVVEDPTPVVEEPAPPVEAIALDEPTPVTEGPSPAIQEPAPVQSHTEEAIPEVEIAVVEREVAAPEPEIATFVPEVAPLEPETVVHEPEVAASEPEVAAPEQEVALLEPKAIAQAEPEPELTYVPEQEVGAAVHEPDVTPADQPEAPVAEVDKSALEPEVATVVQEPEPDAIAESEPDPGPEVVVEPGVAEPEPEPEVVAEPKADVLAEPEPETEVTKLVPEPVPEVVAEPVPEVVAEPVPEVVAEPVPEVVAEPVPEVVAEPASEVTEPLHEPELTPEPVAEPETDIAAPPGPDTEVVSTP